MSPELVARIEASLGLRAKKGQIPGARPAIVAVARLLVFSLIVVLIGFYFRQNSQKLSVLSKARTVLLSKLSREDSIMSPGGAKLVSLAERILKEESQAYQGDRGEEEENLVSFDAQFKERGIYVRGPIDAFRSQAQFELASSRSKLDAFIYCLVRPPSSVEEKKLLKSVKDVHRRKQAFLTNTKYIERLQAPMVTMKLLDPAWAKQVQVTEKLFKIRAFSEAFEQAPLAQAHRALEAKFLLALLDEKKATGAVVEFDGASPHAVRIVVVKMDTQEVVIRKRLLVSPKWISEKRRHRYAQGLIDCRLAVEFRNSFIKNASPIAKD